MTDTPAPHPPTQDDAGPSTAPAARHLARNLASLRHARHLTQAGLAKAAAVPRSTVANLESGTGNPSLAVLVKVAHALGVPIDESRCVIGGDVLYQRKGLRAADYDFAHMADIEDTGVAANREMLGDSARVLNRHIPAAKIDHFGPEGAMNFIEGGFSEGRN